MANSPGVMRFLSNPRLWGKTDVLGDGAAKDLVIRVLKGIAHLGRQCSWAVAHRLPAKGDRSRRRSQQPVQVRARVVLPARYAQKATRSPVCTCTKPAQCPVPLGRRR
jgi:hypothetical protein